MFSPLGTSVCMSAYTPICKYKGPITKEDRSVFKIFGKILVKKYYMPQKNMYTANFGIHSMLEAYFDIKSFYLVENRLENLSVNVEIGIPNEVKFLGGK